MSHNKIKVGDEIQDVSGNISIDLNNLSDVSIAGLNVNQMLKYNGSTFENGTASFESDLKFSFVNPTSGWGGGSYNYNVNDYFTVRYFGAHLVQDTGFTPNNATQANTPLSNSRWMESVDIPTAGKYLFIVSLASSGTAEAEWRMRNNAGYFGAKCYNTHDNRYGAVLCGIADCVDNDIFRTVLLVETGTLRNFDDEQMRGVSIQIYKIG